jgi:tetratricopeptide (TPR) repeat protein
MMPTIAEAQFAAALRAAEDPAASPEERAEMLMEIAMGLQSKPRDASELRSAVTLYRRALGEAPAHSVILQSRIRARMGTALQAIPDGGADTLREARECYELALSVLREHGAPEEAAEAELNLGLVIQSLAAAGAARIQDAIQCYHRAVRVFRRETYPREFALLHNNLAIAYLSIPASDPSGRMREALAVQSFEEVLKVINIVDHPGEYAMIQNNLGNALQYASSSHVLENNVRALHAYDEALKVRTRRDTPVEYANTIANKANVLRNMRAQGGDEDERVAVEKDGGQPPHAEALSLYAEARALFEAHGLADRAALVDAAMADLHAEMAHHAG